MALEDLLLGGAVGALAGLGVGVALGRAMTDVGVYLFKLQREADRTASEIRSIERLLETGKLGNGPKSGGSSGSAPP